MHDASKAGNLLREMPRKGRRMKTTFGDMPFSLLRKCVEGLCFSITKK